jgi:5-formyltetrahydrofolate cyclo-ligase
VVNVPPTLGDADRLRLEGEKSRRRRMVWDALEREGMARFPLPPHGRIPNFEGAREAAQELVRTAEFRGARVVKVNPDAPQLPVRSEVLRSGKLLVMAVPRLREPRCFRLLRPGTAVSPTIEGGLSRGEPLLPEEVPPVDLVVVGSVVVGPRGERLGKGGGFSDLEWGLLSARGQVGVGTRVATTIHPLQRSDANLPVLPHDVPLDLAATPAGVERFPTALPRPTGILPEDLSPATLSGIPWLREWMARRERRR